MSFRDNLQHLRATRNMTQEQLAMLLGVSRQTVTKWEAEKSNPEMDKLIDMCRIFDCTLDDLVRGDLTDRPREAVAMPSSGAPVDVCGYDEHMRGWAFSVATGVAVIILGVSAGMLFAMADLLPGAGDAPFFVAVLAAVLVGLAFLIPAGVRHSAFAKAHPYIEDFYTIEEKTRARESVTRAVVCGIGLIFAGAAAVLLSEGTAYEAHAAAAMLASTAAGVWLFIYFGMMSARTNVAQRNKTIADELEYEDILNAQIEDDIKQHLLQKKKAGDKLGAVCGVIMIVATIVGLGLLFGPVLSSPDPSSFEPKGTSAMWFWTAWPVGGMLCGIVALLMNAFGRRDE